MGITLKAIHTLQEKAILTSATQSLLDVGSSNLYQATPQGILEFLKAFGVSQDEATNGFAEKLARGSAYDNVSGGKNEAFVGELFERAGIRYEAIDIADGYRTTILDLNHQPAPPEFVGAFDLVINFGTTEHLLNQYNAFKVLHDSVRTGGFIVHSLPCVGYANHGYFTYTPRCMFDLAGYNRYEVVDFWFEGPGAGNDLFQPLSDYSSYFPALTTAVESMKSREIGEHLAQMQLKDVALQVVFRKVYGRPFAGALEMTTSVGKVPSAVTNLYSGLSRIDAAKVVEKGRALRDLLGAFFAQRRRRR